MRQIYINALKITAYQHGYLEGLARLHYLNGNSTKSKVFDKQAVAWQIKCLKLAKRVNLNKGDKVDLIYKAKNEGLKVVSSRYDNNKKGDSYGI